MTSDKDTSLSLECVDLPLDSKTSSDSKYRVANTKERCLYGNTLNDGYEYIYNTRRGTKYASCGQDKNCWCCRRLNYSLDCIDNFHPISDFGYLKGNWITKTLVTHVAKLDDDTYIAGVTQDSKFKMAKFKPNGTPINNSSRYTLHNVVPTDKQDMIALYAGGLMAQDNYVFYKGNKFGICPMSETPSKSQHETPSKRQNETPSKSQHEIQHETPSKSQNETQHEIQHETPSQWKKNYTVEPPYTLLGHPKTKVECQQLCQLSQSKGCAFQCNGCWGGPNIQPALNTSTKCFQYATKLNRFDLNEEIDIDIDIESLIQPESNVHHETQDEETNSDEIVTNKCVNFISYKSHGIKLV